MSAAATAAGYLYAAGKQSPAVKRRNRGTRLEQLVSHYIDKGVEITRARELATEALSRVDAW